MNSLYKLTIHYSVVGNKFYIYVLRPHVFIVNRKLHPECDNIIIIWKKVKNIIQ